MQPTVVESDTKGWRANVGSQVMTLVGRDVVLSDPRWSSLRANLAITGGSWDELASKMIIAGGGGLVLPPLFWVFAQWAGVSIPLVVPFVLAVLAVPAGLSLPVVELFAAARRRRRHVRVVVGTFVDLVVLGLAGGVGIEGAMFAASQVSSDWAAKRISRVLLKARDSGQSPWLVLGQLGEELGVNELIELSTTLQLAGTEGARVRHSLMARSTALRRHEQADAESEANAMTERLFLPGALLLVGFLLFVGYPAFSRILGGF
jgi:Flp pilus assembly protein TadB